jgi:hypothetical protein
VILYDNLKSAVLERRGNQIHFHPRLIELSAHYHFVPRPCQVRAGNQERRYNTSFPSSLLSISSSLRAGTFE